MSVSLRSVDRDDGEEFMLPGFRFLFAIVVLSISLLVFGLGAGLLLRTAHDNVASLPSAKSLREAAVMHDREARQTTLALLRVEMIAEQQENVEKMAAAAASRTSSAPSRASDAMLPSATAVTSGTTDVSSGELSTPAQTEAQPIVAATAVVPVSDAPTAQAKADLEKLDSRKSDAPQSDSIKSDLQTSDVEKADAAASSLSQSASSQSDLTQLGLVQVDLLKPDLSEPDLAKAGFAAPSSLVQSQRVQIAALAEPATEAPAMASSDSMLTDAAGKSELMSTLKLVLRSLPELKADAIKARRTAVRQVRIRHAIFQRRRIAAAHAAEAAAQTQYQPFPLYQQGQQNLQGQQSLQDQQNLQGQQNLQSQQSNLRGGRRG